MMNCPIYLLCNIYHYMRIDAHVHMWHRDSLPDQAVRLYLEPLQKLKDLGLDDVFEFKLDNEIPFDDYDTPVGEYTFGMGANAIDYEVILPIDFGLVNEGRITLEEYLAWTFDRCSTDDRFIPFISVDPNRKDAIDILNRLYNKYSPRGIKVYPATGFYPDDPRYDPFWDTIEDMGLVVTTHAGMALAPLDEKYCHPSMMRRAAERHPDTKFIIAHLGGKFYDEMFPLMDACDNVCTDCSALQGWFYEDKTMIHRRLGEMMSRYPDRVVFGTDIPIFEFSLSTSEFIRFILEGDWGTEKMKDDLLGNNMARILGI